MIRFMLTASLATILVSSSARLVLAGSQESQSDTYPVIAQLVLRDLKVRITSASSGRLYSIADESGAILSANLTEDQLAQQYPELFNLLQPAVADDESEMLMLAPIVN